MQTDVPNTDRAVEGVLLCGGLHISVIESQAILSSLMMKKEGVNIEIWSLCLTAESYYGATKKLSGLSTYGVPIRLIRGIKPAIPFADIFNALILSYWVHTDKRKIEFVHCRSDDIAAIAGLAKIFTDIRVIWDVRGDMENEFLSQVKEWSTIKRSFSFLKHWQIRLRKHLAKRFSDSAIFVSESMRNSMTSKSKNVIPSVIIPCLADKKRFYFNLNLRNQVRSELGISSFDNVLIYSGSLEIWQCIPETIQLIEDFLKEDPIHKAIVLTRNRDGFTAQLSTHLRELLAGRLFCFSAGFMDVNKYLNAADFGVLLRKDNPVNKVASPVKFAEYSLAGLPVIMTDAVEQSYQYATKIGNLVQFEFGKKLCLKDKFGDHERAEIAKRAQGLLSNEYAVEKYLEVYGYKR